MPIHHTVKVGNPMPVTQEGDLSVSLQPEGGTEDVGKSIIQHLASIDNTQKQILKQLELITEERLRNAD